MTYSELKSTIILGLIFASRLLGLFMVLPVLALYVGKMAHATPALIGLGAGIYGLTQALFQLPCGVLSDYLGRKPVIVAGLVVFIIGSLTAALSETIIGLIVGRAIQGMGAIGSPILALVSDLTREEVRTRAMALIGISIGLTFVLAIIVGPLIDASIGLSGIFFLAGALGTGGIFLLYFLDPAPYQAPPLLLTASAKMLLKHPSLWRVNGLIFMVHAMLTAFFLVLPTKIETLTGLSGSNVWRFYLPVLLLSLIFVAPLLRYSDTAFWQKKLMQSAILGLGVSIVLLIYATHIIPFFVFATLFFLAFNYLEASLPALVSRLCATSKGSALGVYSFSQFLGMFTGGILGGFLQQWMGPEGIGLGCLLFTLIGYMVFLKNKGFEQWQEELIK